MVHSPTRLNCSLDIHYIIFLFVKIPLPLISPYCFVVHVIFFTIFTFGLIIFTFCACYFYSELHLSWFRSFQKMFWCKRITWDIIINHRAKLKNQVFQLAICQAACSCITNLFTQVLQHIALFSRCKLQLLDKNLISTAIQYIFCF